MDGWMVVVCVDDGWIDRCDDRSVDGDNFVVVRNFGEEIRNNYRQWRSKQRLPAAKATSVGLFLLS